MTSCCCCCCADPSVYNRIQKLQAFSIVEEHLISSARFPQEDERLSGLYVQKREGNVQVHHHHFAPSGPPLFSFKCNNNNTKEKREFFFFLREDEQNRHTQYSHILHTQVYMRVRTGMECRACSGRLSSSSTSNLKKFYYFFFKKWPPKSIR